MSCFIIFSLIFYLRPGFEILQNLTHFGHDGPYYFQDDIRTKHTRVITQAPQVSPWHKGFEYSCHEATGVEGVNSDIFPCLFQ